MIELEQNERALVWRIHHSLADGTMSVRYARALLWDDMTGGSSADPVRAAGRTPRVLRL